MTQAAGTTGLKSRLVLLITFMSAFGFSIEAEAEANLEPVVVSQVKDADPGAGDGDPLQGGNNADQAGGVDLDGILIYDSNDGFTNGEDHGQELWRSDGTAVGTALIAEGLVRHLPPGRRRSHVLRLVAEILSRPAGGATDLEAGLHSLLAALDRRVVLFILSDFLDASLERALKAARRHDVVLVEILDPHDVDPPETAPVVLRDAESGRSVLFGDTLGGLLTGKRAARRLRDERRRQRSALLQQARRLGLDHLTLWTHRPYLPPLLAFFEARRRRLRHG